MLREVSALKVKVVAHNAAASLDPAQLLKTKVPGTSVVAFSHATSRSVVQVYASVAVACPANVAELRSSSGVPIAGAGVPVEEVLEDLCRQLWLGMPFAARCGGRDWGTAAGPGDHSAYLCIPVSISVNATKYSVGKFSVSAFC